MTVSILDRFQSSGRLPTPPMVVLKLLELTRSEDSSVNDIARTLAQDPPLAAKLLRFANSPMSGISREVTSLERAVGLIGARGVKMMALSFAVVAAKDSPECDGFDRVQFGMQSIGCGVAAKHLAKKTDSVAPQDAFVAGLLSQIGRSVFSSGSPDEYARILAEARIIPDDLVELEQAAFGTSYPALGAELLRSWGLPDTLCSAIESFRDTTGGSDSADLLKILRLGETAAHIICPDSNADAPALDAFVRAADELMSISEEDCTELLSAIATEIEDTRVSLEMPRGVMRAPEDIAQEARERVAELGLALQMENRALAQQQEDLMRRATTDALTGIGNRAALDARLALEVERATRFGGPIALIMCDVDHFKSFNDEHGHQAGDHVLQDVARVLDANIRKVDYVARFGGEEFAVIAPESTPAGADLLAERLRTAIEESTVVWQGQTLRVTISMGVALVAEPNGEQTGARLIAEADARLYEAKRAGRNRVGTCADAPTEHPINAQESVRASD